MAKESDAQLVSLLQLILIVELAKAGISQKDIRDIVGGDIRRVNKVAKHFKKRM